MKGFINLLVLYLYLSRLGGLWSLVTGNPHHAGTIPIRRGTSNMLPFIKLLTIRPRRSNLLANPARSGRKQQYSNGLVLYG